ncbi:MAG: DUF2298 domain-containing protein [Chloroflexi bacterium]|nr:DUF2298 domain-containing protein [Chloroflexota bacterium]
MIDFLLWYLVIFCLGWLTFPITFCVFSRLKDRGFGLSKVLGLLVWGYFFWLMNMLGLSQNTPGGLLLAGAVLVIISAICLRKGRWQELRDWIKDHRRVILFTELVFLVLFSLWTFIRATAPEVSGTEKPMELAFITSILRADSFPPQDPWLSGYAISYYYFGYVMAAMLIKITGTTAWVGFNLASALWFALTGVAAFSLVYSLISGLGRSRETANEQDGKSTNLVWSLLGPLYVLIVSNMEGFLEMLHSRGLFWQTTAEGTLQSRFWSWLDIQEIVQAPTSPYSWIPERPAGIWWWRASRVLQDYTASGQSREIIDEFPFFSYYLADLHPHVLSMPFVILAISFAFNFFLTFRSENQPGISVFEWAGEWFHGKTIPLQNLTIFPLLSNGSFWIAALITGSLGFLNTWDFPIYVGLFGAVYVYQRYQALGWGWQRLLEFLTFCILMGIVGVLLFLPFYVGFSSQAGGLLPSLFFFTRGIHFWVMFLPLLFPLCWWLFSQVNKGNIKFIFRRGIKFAALVLVGLGLLSYLLGWLGVLLPVIGNSMLGDGAANPLAEKLIQWGNLFYSVQGITSPADIWTSVKLRVTQPGTWLTAGIMVVLVWGLLSARKKPSQSDQEHVAGNNAFILLLILLGLGLVIFPEFFYLRDQFGWRINTIFKFYFQTWILWSIAAAAVSVLLWKSLTSWKKSLFGVLWSVVLLMCLAYPWFGLSMKVKGIDLQSLSLNGAQHIEQYSPDDMKAIEWLVEADDGVILEAVGGSYSGYARISTFSGLSTVLGWPGHESQWRGGYDEMGSRKEDIKQIYQSNNWDETLALLQKYSVNYIYIGSYENNTYHVNEEKFIRNLGIVYENDTVRIFEVPESIYQNIEGETLP